MTSLSDPLVQQLVNGRYIAALATHNPDNSIHAVSVWYMFDGGRVYVGTSSRSRKLRNVELNSSVSIMIDARDPAASSGVSIAGTAQILTGDLSRQWNRRIHQKYLSEAALADPKVGPAFSFVDDVTVEITPIKVISWDMRQIDQQFFGGAIEKNPKYLLPLER